MPFLAKAALKTIAFFDAMNVPLTLIEIKSYLAAFESDTDEKVPVSLSDLDRVLREDLFGQVEHSGAFYFLRGRSDLVSLRQERYLFSVRRHRKARRYLAGLRYIPYLRGVALAGSTAILNSREDSDIDIFLVTRQGRIWLTRFLVSAYFQLLGQRRYRRFTKNRFCLNHYVVEQAELFEDRNLYSAVIYAILLPALGEESFQGFWRANKWVAEYLNGPFLEQKNIYFKVRFSPWQIIFERVLDYTFIGLALERIFRFFQARRIHPQDHIYVSNHQLSFHPDSKGQQVLARYYATLRSFNFQAGQ